MNGLDAMLKNNRQEIAELLETIKKQKGQIERINKHEKDLSNTIQTINKKLANHRDQFNESIEKVQKELKQQRISMRRIDLDLEDTMTKVRFQEQQRVSILDMIKKQVVPVNDILFQQTAIRKQHGEAIEKLDQKLNKSYLLIVKEIDNFKNPLLDALQDVDNQRFGMMRELERTQNSQRQLLMQTMKEKIKLGDQIQGLLKNEPAVQPTALVSMSQDVLTEEPTSPLVDVRKMSGDEGSEGTTKLMEVKENDPKFVTDAASDEELSGKAE